jgi:hypothetical protein
MPITFEQAGPYDKSISEAYGSAQAMKDFLPFLQKSYGGRGGGGGSTMGGGPGGSRGGGGGGDDGISGGGRSDPYQDRVNAEQAFRNQQVAAVNRMTVDPNQYDSDISALQDRQAGDAATDDAAWQRGDQAAPDTVEPSDMTDQQWQQAGGAAGVNPQDQSQTPQAPPRPPPEFTQADGLQLSRLQASKAEVQAQLRNGMLDPGTARRMISQIQTGIDPMRMAQQAAATQGQQEQTRQLQDQNARRTSMLGMDAEHFAQMGQRNTFTTQGGHEIYVSPIDGHPTNLGNPRQDAAENRQQTQQQAAESERHDHEGFTKALTEVEKSVLGVNPTAAPTDAQREQIDEAMRRRGYHSGNYGTHLTARQDNQRSERIAAQVSSQMEQEARGTNRPAWASSPEARQEEAWNRTEARRREAGIRGAAPAPEPVPANLADAPEHQRVAMGRFNEIRRRLDEEGYAGEKFNRAMSLYRKYGSSDAMPPQQRAFYREIIGQMDRAYGPQIAPPSSPPPSQSGLGPRSQILVDNPGS